ncbi:MAG: DUF721 domain-containing protein [Rickettsiales bacterium]
MDGLANAPARFTRRPRRADAPLFAALEEEYKRRNIGEKKIFTDWPVIVGRELAAVTAPLRIKFRSKNDASLYVALYRPGLALELQMRQTDILENLARYLGHRKVCRMTVRHCFAPPKKEDRSPPPRPRDDALWNQYLERIPKTNGDDVEFFERLENFARAFCGRSE